jgi:N-acetylmuramoyl-L-alanine amidase
MKKFTRMHRGFVEQAGFVVLKNPDIPSLLIETGFITNPEEARNLSSPKFRSTMAKGIFAGIDSHFRSKPPMDTALAAARGGKVTESMDKIKNRPDPEPLVSHEPILDETDDLEKLVAKKSLKEEKSVKTETPTKKEQSVQKISQPQLVAKPTAKKAAPEKTVKHVVKKGETLSGIASRYKISMATLRTYNKMDDQQVRIGQTLKIPATSN